MAESKIQVRYVSNNTPRNTTEMITLEDGDDIRIGEEGEVTKDEFNRLQRSGCVLEVVEDKKKSSSSSSSSSSSGSTS